MAGTNVLELEEGVRVILETMTLQQINREGKMSEHQCNPYLSKSVFMGVLSR